MREHLMMSQKERIRKAILEKFSSRYINLQEAAYQMRISYRQAKRIWKRYREKGDEGLLHRNRGNPAVSHGFYKTFKRKVLERYVERYEGFGPTLAAEKLAKEGRALNHETLRKWLIEEG